MVPPLTEKLSAGGNRWTLWAVLSVPLFLLLVVTIVGPILGLEGVWMQEKDWFDRGWGIDEGEKKIEKDG